MPTKCSSRLCEGPLIEKWRHIVVHAGDDWEIDEFLGENAGLVIAELELDSEQQAFARRTGSAPKSRTISATTISGSRSIPIGRWPENLRAAP
jgi:hypothetical protein